MSRIYPNIDGEKDATTGVCLTCGMKLTTHNMGKTFNVEVSYMNGDDESETYCRTHAHERRTEINSIKKQYQDREAAAELKEAAFMDSLLERLKAKYSVDELTATQWRINGVLDLYPVNRKWHDLKNNKRGRYGDVFRFCETFFCSELALLPHP